MKTFRLFRFRFRSLTAAVLAVLLSIGVSSSIAQGEIRVCPESALIVTPTNWQAVLTSAPEGSTFCFEDGLYNGFSTAPKPSDTYIAQNIHGAILEGGDQITEANIETAFGRSDGANASVPDVVIDGFIIRNYYSDDPFQRHRAAVQGGPGWSLLGNVFEDNTAAVSMGTPGSDCVAGTLIENNTFRDNTHAALHWNGTDGRFVGNSVYRNGFAATQDEIMSASAWTLSSQGAGGIPCERRPGDRILVSSNTIAANRGIGWWQKGGVGALDGTTFGPGAFDFSGNTVIGNTESGLVHEASYGGQIINNVFGCNLSNLANGMIDLNARGGEIFIVSASSIVVSQNIITVCATGDTILDPEGRQSTFGINDGRGIMLFNDGREPSLANIAITNNTIYMGGSGSEYPSALAGMDRAGVVRDTNVVWGGNTYRVREVGRNIYSWFGFLDNFTTWQSRGIEADSVEIVGEAPAWVMPTPFTPPTQPPPTPTAVPPTLPPPTPTLPAGTPFLGQPAPIPGQIQAENFDLGGQGIGFVDTTRGNEAGPVYRTDIHNVDLKESAGGVVVGWFIDGEWLQYNVDVTQAGTYDVDIVTGTVDEGRYLSLSMNGVPIASSVLVPRISTWDSPLPTVRVSNVRLEAGVQYLRVNAIRGFLDFDALTFTFIGP